MNYYRDDKPLPHLPQPESKYAAVKQVIVAEFPSKSKHGDVHFIKQTKDFRFCSCPAYKWNSTCSHLTLYERTIQEDKETSFYDHWH